MSTANRMLESIDDAIQMGEGDGPDVVVGSKTIEKICTKNLSVCIKVPNAVEMIQLDIQIS